MAQPTTPQKPDTPPGQDPNRTPPGQQPGSNPGHGGTPPGQDKPKPDQGLPEQPEGEPKQGLQASTHDPENDDAYPRPRVRLARNWVQPRRPYNHAKDYHRLPRFRPDFGRMPFQHASR